MRPEACFDYDDVCAKVWLNSANILRTLCEQSAKTLRQHCRNHAKSLKLSDSCANNPAKIMLRYCKVLLPNHLSLLVSLTRSIQALLGSVNVSVAVAVAFAFAVAVAVAVAVAFRMISRGSQWLSEAPRGFRIEFLLERCHFWDWLAGEGCSLEASLSPDEKHFFIISMHFCRTVVFSPQNFSIVNSLEPCQQSVCFMEYGRTSSSR